MSAGETSEEEGQYSSQSSSTPSPTCSLSRPGSICEEEPPSATIGLGVAKEHSHPLISFEGPEKTLEVRFRQLVRVRSAASASVPTRKGCVA